MLVANGVEVITVVDTPDPPTQDSIIPNNWLSTHANGTICLFPMYAKNRRLERKPNVLETIQRMFHVERTVDLTWFEAHKKFLEGTWSMALDRGNGLICASRSARTHEDVLKEFASQLGFSETVLFESHDESGNLIYHTNVMMSVGHGYFIICLDAISDPAQREQVKTAIAASGKEVVSISKAQVNNFVGNMLQVQNVNGDKFLVMSSRAYKSLTDEQLRTLEKYNSLLHSDLTTIEDNGGGGARCLMAEIYLNKK